MRRLRLGGLGGIDGGVEPVGAALLLKTGNLGVEHLHLARLAWTQLVADIETIDHDVILNLAGVLHDHPRRRCVKSLLAWLGAHRRVVVGHLPSPVFQPAARPI